MTSLGSRLFSEYDADTLMEGRNLNPLDGMRLLSTIDGELWLCVRGRGGGGPGSGRKRSGSCWKQVGGDATRTFWMHERHPERTYDMPHSVTDNTRTVRLCRILKEMDDEATQKLQRALALGSASIDPTPRTRPVAQEPPRPWNTRCE